MAVMCLCDAGLLGWGRQENPLRGVAVLADLAVHEDWQVRELAAEKCHPRWFKRSPDRDDLRRATLHLLHRLSEDPNPNVRGAAAWSIRGHIPDMGMSGPWHWGGRDFTDPDLAADVAADRAADLPLIERLLVAEGQVGPAPGSLLADPLCEVRASAVTHCDSAVLTDGIARTLYGGPCDWVRHMLVWRVGPPEGSDLTLLGDSAAAGAAHATGDPAVLTELGARDEFTVRMAVAANPACPLPVLLTLGDDPQPWVRAAAYGNPHWPDGRPVRPTVDPGTLPIDPFKLADAVIGTRTPVRCMAGRSQVANSSGWFLPPADAVGFCDRDAVSLHSWGAFCRTHQEEVDQAKQHGGADGYLGQRKANGVWVRLFQCGPLDPLRDLWDGRAGPTSP